LSCERGAWKVAQDLLADDLHHFDTLFARHGVYCNVPMDADELFRVQDAVLVLQIRQFSVSESRLAKMIRLNEAFTYLPTCINDFS
jgi:hypothetical protein